MRDVILFIAMSLDGYIADREGNVGWLCGEQSDMDDMESYEEFIKEIDTVIIGHNTYQQLVTELSPGKWPYQDLESYVITHNQYPAIEGINFVDKPLSDLIMSLKQREGRGIWICGGAGIVRQLMQTNLIDRYCITVIPTIIGGGIRLFHTSPKEIKLKLICTRSYNGLTDLVYERREGE